MKRNYTKGNWTRFWRYLKVDLAREDRWNPTETYAKDFRRLRRLGVDITILNKVQREFNKYNAGHLQFHRFSYFFAKDPETVRRWTRASNISSAFLKFSNKLLRNKNDIAKSLLSELLLLIELYKKKEIIQYDSKFTRAFSSISVNSRSLLSTLKIGETNAGFKIEKELIFDGYKVFCFSKKTGGSQKVYKFILLKKVRNKLLIILALDTPEERRKILGHISKKLSIVINKLKDEPELPNFINFVKTGTVEPFTLIGVDFVDQGYKVSISPQYGRPANVTENEIYKQILPASDIEILESIQRVKIIHSSIQGNQQVYISFLNSRNEDIIGGMKLVLDAKGLSISKRESIKEDFMNNYNFHLDTPLIFEVDEEEIYKKFLQNPPKKKKKIEIVSDKSIEISHKLALYKLLPHEKSVEETAKLCTYHGCTKKFKSQWVTDSICVCGHELWTGSTIVTKIIDEKTVRDFFNRIATETGYRATPLIRDLLKRKIYPIEILKDNQTVCLIPITTPLKDQQLDVLKYRYPNLIFVTSRDDADTLESKGFKVLRLYKLVYDLFEDPQRKIESLLETVTTDKTDKIRALADISARRFMNDAWYLEQGNIGPEFFEADSTMILNYIFKNSVWLGAKRRGERLPDSFSAFPIEDTNRGCFISDSKFSMRATADIGSVDKNKKYITDGKKNESVRNNGGLRGFVFTSNKPAPSNFVSKMKKVVGRKIVKAGYLTNSQLLLIYNHLKHWEHELDMDRRKRDIFLSSMEEIFLNSTSVEDRFIVWSDDGITQILNQNIEQYRSLGSPDLEI